jgi:hypothetical protein
VHAPVRWWCLPLFRVVAIPLVSLSCEATLFISVQETLQETLQENYGAAIMRPVRG